MQHFKKWPSGIPKSVDFPDQSLIDNLYASVQKTPERTAMIFYGAEFTYAELLHDIERLSGYLQSTLMLKTGEPVLLYLQNSPQFIISYYGILHAGGVVVPVNPMSRHAEVAYLQADTDARILMAGGEVFEHAVPLLLAGKLEQILVTNYAERVDPAYDLKLPASLVYREEDKIQALGCTLWSNAIQSARPQPPVKRTAHDLAIIPYSSGTTGQPKGCMHSHASTMATAVGGVLWHQFEEHSISLVTLPLFHVTGMQGAMNGPIYAGGTMVIMARWDREVAAELIKRYQITRWRSISTMAIDMVNDPKLMSYDLSSLKAIGGGGAAMPAPVAHKLKEMTGLDYLEGYGLSETMAATHLNPPQEPRAQCLGIPVFDVKSCVWSPESGEILAPNEIGEILMAGPQVFLGYWRRPEDTEAAFVTLDGTRYFRSGDIGYMDEDGFFYMVDRLKRMINVSGFKVWPAEIEAMMHAHPDIAEACVIGSTHPRKGEAVKAIIVPTDPASPPKADEIITWCKSIMAAYKCPKLIEYMDHLPKSGSGKVMWRALTDAENAQNKQG